MARAWRAVAVSSLSAAALAVIWLACGPLAEADVRADLDGDGRSDLAIGAPTESLGGSDAERFQAGAVHLLYGGRKHLSLAGDRYLTEDTPGLRGGRASYAWFGSKLAAGDFDGDGYADLAIGAPFKSPGGVQEAGAVHVLYGARRGLTVKGDQYLTENSRGIRGGGALSYDYFGSALAAGDLNRDGRDDLAIGAPSKEVFYDDSSDGAVHVLYGGRRHLRARDDQYLTADNLGFPSRSAADAGFGASLAAGDLNGDGRADLVVGSPAERVGEDERAGAVRTLLGGPRHLRRGSVRRLTENTKRMAGPGAGYGARFGSSLVIGRLNYGGRHDLAIGAPQAVQASSSEHLGAVHVLYGRRRGPSVRGDQYLSTRAPGIRGRGREFGHALATGDLNGDGHDELTIGAPRQGTGGAVHVLYGARRKLRLRNTQLLTQDRPGMAGDDPYPDDGFGFVLGSGDFDGDGRADLAIGEPQDRYGGFGGCATSLGGAVHVLYGARKRLSLKGDQFLTQDTPGVAGSGSEPCDAFGRGLANPFR